MSELTEDDFNEARLLAREAGEPDEQIDVLRVLAADEGETAGGPWTLVASAGEGTLKLFYSHWLGEEAGERVLQAGVRPTVIGPNPGLLTDRPGFKKWEAFQTSKFGEKRGHMVALTVNGEASAKLRAELAQVGSWDSVIIVTRASMALPQAERDLVRSLSKVSAVGKVLAVAVPGELPQQNDVLKVAQYAGSKLEGLGFSGTRNAGVSFWWLDGATQHLQAIADPAALLVQDPHAAAKGRDLLLRNGLLDFLAAVEKKAADSKAKPQKPLSDADLVEMEENFDKALNGLLHKAEEKCAASTLSEKDLRSYVLDQIGSWSLGSDFTGIWLKLVETLRPGAKTGLFREAEKAVEILSIEAPAKPSQPRRGVKSSPSTMEKNPIPEFAVRVGFAIVCGLILWMVTPGYLLGGFVAATTGAVGTLLGFALGKPLAGSLLKLKNPEPSSDSPQPSKSESPPASVIRNYSLFSHQLRDWFSQHIRAAQLDIPKRCQVLAKRIAPQR